MASLRELIDGPDVPDVEVSAACEDSRRAGPGCVFFARGGTSADGATFARRAVEAGAAAVVADRSLDVGGGVGGVPCVVVPDVAEALGVAAQRLAGSPADRLDVYAVTGTNGKTTTAYLLRHLLGRGGGCGGCGMIGTVEIDDGRDVRPAAMTTPPAVELAGLLAAMRGHGCRAVAVEASSHALDQRRLAGVPIKAAGFTNLTGDHLDYHGDMNAYAAAKARLFAGLAPGAVAAVNADSPHAGVMLAATPPTPTNPTNPTAARRVTFSPTGRDADYRATDLTVTAEGTTFVLHTPHGSAEVAATLIGRHNVENMLCAAAMVGEAAGHDAATLAAGLSSAPGVPGRLEKVGDRPAVLVDYAHTDDALANVLGALRPLVPASGRLRVVFGCGGDRDRAKRPRMAEAAERLADDVYVTSDNPRTEDPGRIADDVVAGLTRPAVVELDRRLAIRRAVGDAGVDDVVLIAGKGHEDYQIVGDARRHFDDREEARAALAGRERARGG